MTKEQILNEIKRTAQENGGIPLGMRRFKKETGISLYDCQSHWPTFGEAQREAGFTANTLQIPHDEEFIFESLIALMREIGRFPTRGDLVVKRNKDAKFPSPSSIHRRYGEKKEIAGKISEYCSTKNGYSDIIGICQLVSEKLGDEEASSTISPNEKIGSVYLFKSGKYYKIGKTNDTVRRGNELRIQLPEQVNLHGLTSYPLPTSFQSEQT